MIIVFKAFDNPSTLAMGLITISKTDDALPHIIQQFKNTTYDDAINAFVKVMF